MPLDFQFKEPPLPLEFQKAARGIGMAGMDMFWNYPIHFKIPLNDLQIRVFNLLDAVFCALHHNNGMHQ